MTETKTSHLAALQAALTTLQASGIPVSVAQLHGAQTNSIAIIIPGIVLVDGQLIEDAG